jgi:1,4-alpha-glucan branching enzyme
MVSKGRKKGTMRFVLVPGDSVGKVELAGDFNSWQPIRMRKRKNGSYVAVVALAPGIYDYKFVVDGQWRADPDNSAWAMNPYGTLNSVVEVK